MGFETSFFAGETLDILRASRQVDPFSGEEGERDWDNPMVVASFFEDQAPFAPIIPSSSSVSPEQLSALNPEGREEDLLAFFPYETDLDEDDRILVKSGPYRREKPYELDSIKFYKNPFDGELLIAVGTLVWREG